MAIFYPLFVICLFLSTVSANVNWSIDCGTSGNSTVDKNSIRWIGDDTVISTGQPESVSGSYLYSSSDPSSFVVNTLRAFPSGTKNCYVLKGEMGAKVQLRVMFYYGNYDGKSAPPTFALQFDGNDWATVETTMDLNTYLYYDVVYVTKGDNINVCLIQTNPSHVPFVSAIEVRTLNSTMYDLADYGNALFLVSRRSFSTKSVRYPTDAYDRIWAPMSLTGSQYTRLTYNGSVINTSTSPEEPPQDVLKNALTSTSTGTLKWTIPELPSTPISVYLMIYFAEMTVLASTQTRAFSVFIGGTLMNSTIGLVPAYGGVTELTVYNILMSSTTPISLVPAVYSTEPPLINAMEVFQVSDYMVSYTSATASSPSPPDSSSDDTPPPPSSLSDDTPSPPPPPPPPRSFSSGKELGSTYGDNKSHSQEILRAVVPVLVFLTVFTALVLIRRKRTRVTMMSGTNTREVVGYNNVQNQNQMMNNDHGKGVAMNEFTVNVKDSNNGGPDTADRAYPSPAPLLKNHNNYHA